jgi:hypothetical protein
MKSEYRSRIVGHGEEEPGQLLANPANWRIHPKAQQDALNGVLEEVGWVQSVIVNKRTGNLVDGHLRVSLALREDAKSVPVAYVDLSPEEEVLVLATLDPLASLAIADSQKLEELLNEIGTGSSDVQAMLSKLAADTGIIPPDFEPTAADDQSRLDKKSKSECPKCGYEF